MPDRLLGRGEAPGKAILAGEHAVVYGRPALAIPTSAHTLAVDLLAAPAGAPRGSVAWDLDVECSAADRERLDAAVARTREALGGPGDAVLVRVRSRLPAEAGMGSSAALAVALARAFAAWAGRPLDRAEAARVATETERLFHGRASGLDPTTSAWGVPLAFRVGRPPEPLRVAGRHRFLLAHSGVVSSTREAVAAVAARRERDPQGVEALFDVVEACVAAARAALEDGDAEALAGAMARNHAALRALDVSHPAVEAAIARALSAGARAAKVTGAGRGGLVLALCGEDPGPLRAAFPGALEVELGPIGPA